MNHVIAYALKHPINAHADVSCRARGLNFGLHIHLHPYFVCKQHVACCWKMLILFNSCRRVHISKATLNYLGDEFQVEPGEGSARDSYLRGREITTYLIKQPERKVQSIRFLVFFTVSSLLSS